MFPCHLQVDRAVRDNSGFRCRAINFSYWYSAWLNLICFVVGWLPIFEYGQGRRRGVPGTGWGVVGAYLLSPQIPLLLSPLTLGIPSPSRGIKALEANKRQAFSVTTVICGIGLIIFPYLAWVASGSVELSALMEEMEILLPTKIWLPIVRNWGSSVIAGLMRLRPKGLAEPGPNLLLSHCLLGAAVLALTMPLGIIISCFQRSGLDIELELG
ncbi:MAG: hypothetical protein CM15mP49_16770 [Actinomycetota bacterium]|nr:MAG: hypothetical protein CM15mP49_16770 [Actinomycetota bacterium]